MTDYKNLIMFIINMMLLTSCIVDITLITVYVSEEFNNYPVKLRVDSVNITSDKTQIILNWSYPSNYVRDECPINGSHTKKFPRYYKNIDYENIKIFYINNGLNASFSKIGKCKVNYLYNSITQSILLITILILSILICVMFVIKLLISKEYDKNF